MEEDESIISIHYPFTIDLRNRVQKLMDRIRDSYPKIVRDKASFKMNTNTWMESHMCENYGGNKIIVDDTVEKDVILFGDFKLIDNDKETQEERG